MAERWYVVHSKPRQEAVALEHLEDQGFTVWLPRIARRVRRKNSWSTVVEPLFARYLFLCVDPHAKDISPIRSTRGVSGLVRSAGEPLEVPLDVIESLRAEVDPETGLHRFSDSAAPSLKAGDTVRVLEGPFVGLEGIYQKPSGEARALVLLTLLSQPTSVKLPVETLDRLS